MPSKQTNDDVIAIEELVNEIKLNLRLKAAPTTTGAAQTLHHPLLQAPSCDLFLQQPKNNNLNHPQQQQSVIKKQRSRPSPYHLPCRSWSENSTAQKSRSLQKKNDENIDDPYELLQSLLKNNSLVKEAVRRLQITNSYSRKQNYFYDSDEDNRSPIVMMCQLES
jgi:Glycogen synthase kinase-3 binding